MALIWLIIARDFKDLGEIPKVFPSSPCAFSSPSLVSFCMQIGALPVQLLAFENGRRML